MRAAVSAVAAAVALALGLAAAAAPTAADPQAAASVMVQPRDTLIGISSRLLAQPSDWPAVARFNGLRNPNLLRLGENLRFPLVLLRSEAAPATLLAAGGPVRRADTADAPQAGSSLGEGTTLRTGDEGNLVVRLVDGSVLRLRPNSDLNLRDSRRYPGVGQVRSSVQLRDGRVDVQSPPAKGGQPGFRVNTPQGLLAVRGTEFRVAVQASVQRTLGEVLQGAVAVEGSAGGSQRLEAGFGTRLGASGRVEAPVRLLPAPEFDGLPTLQERPLVVFSFPALSGAAGYRAQVARAGSPFDVLLAELTFAAPPLRVAGLPDGEYMLRLRAVDANGVEGRDAALRFTLRARPEPPLPRQPAHRAQLRGAVDFAWTANPQAASYRWQLTSDAQFSAVLREQRALKEPALQLPDLPAGRYHWRPASERSDTDAGPWGDALEFDLLATPPPPQPNSEVDDHAVSLSWSGPPGQSFELEIARDSAFMQPLVQQRLQEPGYRFVPPGPGRWYMRLRVQEADGYVGPWGGTQFFEVPNCLRSTDGSCWRASGMPVLAEVLSSLPNGMLVCDGQGRVLMGNAQAAALFEVDSADDMQGLDLARLLGEFGADDPIDWPSLLDGLEPDGERAALQARLAGQGDYVLRLAAVELAGKRRILVAVADVEPVKRAERQREEALAFVSHDLRSPAASIVLLADMALAGAAKTPPGLLAEVWRLAQRLLAMSEDFVRYAQADLAALQRSTVTLAELLEQAVSDLRPQADDAGVALRLLPHDPAASATLDLELVARAIANLVSNAIRHSPRGSAVRLSTASDNGWLIVQVSDQGSGLASRQHEQLASGDEGLRSAHKGGVAGSACASSSAINEIRCFLQACLYLGLVRWSPGKGAPPESSAG
jgi:signal transduction histidine kinase